jgi:hypothetical protein
MDILKYGPGVEVLEPAELREEVKARLRLALRRYGDERDCGAASGFEAEGCCNERVSGETGKRP